VTAVSHIVEMSQCRVWLLSTNLVIHVSSAFLPILINPSFHSYVPLFLYKYGVIDDLLVRFAYMPERCMIA